VAPARGLAMKLGEAEVTNTPMRVFEKRKAPFFELIRAYCVRKTKIVQKTLKPFAP